MPTKISYVKELVKCGKATCRRCPHGPYWYAYWQEGIKTRKRYIGKQLPAEAGELDDDQAVPELPRPRPPSPEEIARKCEAALGLPEDCPREIARKKVWNEKARLTRKGVLYENDIVATEALWLELRKARGWE